MSTSIEHIVKRGNFQHGHTSRNKPTPEYRTWMGMVQRCCDAKCKDYARYGGSGIMICDRWRHSFPEFLSDMGPKPSADYSIDRIDHRGNYEPSNCRWATVRQQQRNRSSNVLITFNGITQPIVAWSESTGIGSDTISWRLKRGWELSRVLNPNATTRLHKRA